MQIEKCLILAAGKGTRMGAIGKVLPKVLWPIFEKTILELEIDYVKSFGCSEIYVNSYHHNSKLKEFFKENFLDKSVTLIEEESEIDIGGAIHNLCKKTGYNGNLLIVNSDQFLLLNEQKLKLAINLAKESNGVLFLSTVNSSDGYNQVLSSLDNIFTGIKKNGQIAKNTSVETYIGMSIVNLNALKPSFGLSKFFESVANPDMSSFHCINVDDCNYWDFGTTKQYYENMFRLLNSDDLFKSFLKQNSAFFDVKVKGNSYNSFVENSINLSREPAEGIFPNTIVLKEGAKGIQGERTLVYKDIVQSVE